MKQSRRCATRGLWLGGKLPARDAFHLLLMNKIRILVVDDDVPLSRLVAILLEKTRLYEVRVENHSTNALATAREFQPALVLLDVDMPGLDGGAVAAQLRADPSLRELPLIFFTSLVSPNESGQSLISRGGELFLPKPVNTAALVSSIETVLAQTAVGA